jgi:hypothetical protein
MLVIEMLRCISNVLTDSVSKNISNWYFWWRTEMASSANPFNSFC